MLCVPCSGIGLCISELENGGRAHRDGRLHVGDQITEVNGTSLVGVEFSRSLSCLYWTATSLHLHDFFVGM